MTVMIVRLPAERTDMLHSTCHVVHVVLSNTPLISP